MSNIPFINKSLIPECKYSYDYIDNYDWRECDMSFSDLQYMCIAYTSLDYKNKIYINLDTPGIVHLLVCQEPIGGDNVSIAYTKLNTFDGICDKRVYFYFVYYFDNEDHDSDVNQVDAYNSSNFDISDVLNLPKYLYDNCYSTQLIRLYTLSSRLHHRIKTFHLCLYRKMTDINTRLHILSFIYG